MEKIYISPLLKVLTHTSVDAVLASSSNFEEPGTGEIGVNPGEGHEPSEALSKPMNLSVWEE